MILFSSITQIDLSTGCGSRECLYQKKLESNDPLPGVLEHNHCATLDDEVAGVMERMIKLKESGTPPIGGMGRLRNSRAFK